LPFIAKKKLQKGNFSIGISFVCQTFIRKSKIGWLMSVSDFCCQLKLTSIRANTWLCQINFYNTWTLRLITGHLELLFFYVSFFLSYKKITSFLFHWFPPTPRVSFTNMLTHSFCALRSPKHKKYCQAVRLFCPFEICTSKSCT